MSECTLSPCVGWQIQATYILIMLPDTMQWLLFAQLFAFGVAAHWDWWLQGLPNCWQDCVASTQDGCSSRKCMCKTSGSSASYLPNAVACAVSTCDADEWALELVLGPLQLYCDAIDFSIPDQVMDNAYSAASDESKQTSTTTTRQVHSSTKESKSKTDSPTLTATAASAPTPTSTPTTTTTGKHSSDETEDLTSAVSTTITETTTDSAGNTLQIIVPIVMGPTSISTGSIVTSTVGGSSRSHSSSAHSTTSASPSPTAQTPSPAPTADPSSTLESGSEETEPPANGNGSPFENMQADAGRWAASAAHMIMGAFFALIVRL
ncbi:hypothetical protein DDE82_002644 [Stemphylium lycopersici]|uniref:Extracellular membrane protein CFEM domain-containing protein n=1 Tax=Stemphylium lycopersici TaxID=183478 RepID=A0A364N3V9_STELY|nr:hypothetical protein TW65_04606 [Stemphylium lycopersici]RAR07670.1 hypothetical protein DDE82_002644 [Stemphylium lycopersici]RAR11143.1 hypothetical protein DDE83_004678 [Stemphylium lycopersici]